MSRRYSCKGAALESFCTGLFTAYGFDPHAAAAISRQLVSADMRGMPSHGVVRVEMYLTHARKGAIDPTAKPEIVKETPTTAVIEGHIRRPVQSPVNWALNWPERKRKLTAWAS